jgi:hypothetical protein
VSGGPALRHADLWHTGIVVDDLAAAKDELGAALGVTWFEGGGEVRLRTGDEVRSVRTSYALSQDGPHHVELCQSVAGTLWTVAPPGQVHHLGWWTEDVVATSAALEAEGLPVVASICFDDDSPPVCAYHRAATGPYIEVVGIALRRMLLPRRSEEQG